VKVVFYGILAVACGVVALLCALAVIVLVVAGGTDGARGRWSGVGFQVGFYLAALVGLRTDASILRLPSFLCVANFAVLMAWLRFARGERIALWSPSSRISTLPPTSAR